MKKLLTLGMIVFLATGMTGCKKGEGDPFLSLRTRTARLTGKWTLSKIASESVTTDADGTSTSIGEFDGETHTTTTTNANGQTTTIGYYSETYEFRKDGTYSKVRTWNDNLPDVQTTEGRWTFVKKNKNAKLKNKEAIVLTETKWSSQNSGTSTAADNWYTPKTYMIYQLKNEEIILNMDYKSTSENVSTTSTWRITLTKM